MEKLVREQAEQALDEADLVIFLCDGSTGVTVLDREVADLVRRRNQPCLLVVNKMDHPQQQRDVSEFYGLGLGDPLEVSAATGRRSGDLLDAITNCFEAAPEETEEGSVVDSIRVVLTGRPNVGKSTLINRLSGYRVSIVDDQPGTTRDATDIGITWKERSFTLIDTAGLRRRARVDGQVEYYSGLRATHSIDRAQVAIVLLDADEGQTTQDGRIMSQVLDAGCAMVVALNKWDLIGPERGDPAAHIERLRDRFPFLRDYPVVCISALRGKRVEKCLEAASGAYDSYSSRVPTAQLNKTLEEIATRLPLSREGKEVKLLYATQDGVAPPRFIIFSNRPDLMPDSYKRFVEGRLRARFGFNGTPLRILWRLRARGGSSR
jgi:GTP-binding protein